MTASAAEPRAKGWLDPIDRISEALFGLIMVLTFTGSLSAAEAGRSDVRTMLIGSIGCNLAWGLIDGIFYLMARLGERSEGIGAMLAVRAATDPETARRAIADALPPFLVTLMPTAALDGVRQRIVEGPDPAAHPHLGKADWLAAFGCFLWVFLCTFPVIIPFVFMQDAMRAMRVSNGIAVGLLFVAGYAFGHVTRKNPWLMGMVMVLVGGTLVGLTIALGG
jgi:hypothetical protein